MNKKAQLAELFGYLGYQLSNDIHAHFSNSTKDIHTYKTKSSLDDNLHEYCLNCGSKSVRTSFCSGNCCKEWNEKKKVELITIQKDLRQRKWYEGIIKKVRNMKKHGILIKNQERCFNF
jgi:hypothetical protein